MSQVGATENDLGAGMTDTYTLSLNYNAGPSQLCADCFAIATPDGHGGWVNAVNKNIGGTKRFVVGPWNAGYGLGTYGVDPGTQTAWAVLDYNADFAAVNNIEQTTTSIAQNYDPTQYGRPVTFTATVAPAVSSGVIPTGSVQFSLDGAPAGAPVLL